MSEPRDGLRIAMWSGPRNISTAMMRAWENRADTTVIDEPFYAHYLLATGVQHPGRDEVIAAQENDAGKVAATPETVETPGQRESDQRPLSVLAAGESVRSSMTAQEARSVLSASHLLLVESVAGVELTQRVYDAAVTERYLWHEFGDSALLLPQRRIP